jgi:hypothetical protein
MNSFAAVVIAPCSASQVESATVGYFFDSQLANGTAGEKKDVSHNGLPVLTVGET